VPLAVLSRQTIISRQLRALSTRARLAESPERAETAVSAQEDQACDAAATTPPVKSMRRALVHSCLGNNRLVASSSPPSPTTQSCTNGDFPVQCESPRIGGDLCTHFISAICRLDCRDRFEVFVSALENCVSRRRELALVETRFECWVSATESQASHAALTIRVASR